MKKITLLFISTLFIFHSSFSQLPVANFSSDTNIICPGFCTMFSNLSTNATSYIWNFPGAGFLDDTTHVQNPTVCYMDPGYHDVTLIAINSNGSDTLTLTNYMYVYPLPPGLSMILNYDTMFAVPQDWVTYQWYRNGNPIPGATDSYYVITQGGSYNVGCSDSNGCVVEAVILDVNLGTEELNSKNEISLFPNPASDMLFISGSAITEGRELKIINSIGEIVMRTLYQKEIDVSGLQNGMYWIEIDGTEKVYRNVFLKQ